MTDRRFSNNFEDHYTKLHLAALLKFLTIPPGTTLPKERQSGSATTRRMSARSESYALHPIQLSHGPPYGQRRGHFINW
ncbi:hypothetical protein TNCT_690961 [Trichonephila clavata]|uniref:Uncharacterized protein n=1 Tax=Trichonephila clavata TaxID=2740835 RepID=A0A8X6KJY2_TRICU|nr:hypothetical protein TNCT_690961 [Trichonephila clavata]